MYQSFCAFDIDFCDLFVILIIAILYFLPMTEGSPYGKIHEY